MKQVTKTKQKDSKDTVKQSKSDIELHKKDKKIDKPTEIIAQKEVSPTVKKVSVKAEVIHEPVLQPQHTEETEQKDSESNIIPGINADGANIIKGVSIHKEDSKTNIIEKSQSVDIPELELVQGPQATFDDYPKELIQDIIHVDKPTTENQEKKSEEKIVPAESQKKDASPAIVSKNEVPIKIEQPKVKSEIKIDETKVEQEKVVEKSQKLIVEENKKDSEIKIEMLEVLRII